MSKQKHPFNPFYAALIIVGVAFTITACAYALLMLHATRAGSSQAVSSLDEQAGWMKLLDERGMEILGVEVLLLALATVGAIGLDQYRANRDAARGGVRPGRPQGNNPGREAGVGSIEER